MYIKNLKVWLLLSVKIRPIMGLKSGLSLLICVNSSVKIRPIMGLK